jgi:hypothetical protein
MSLLSLAARVASRSVCAQQQSEGLPADAPPAVVSQQEQQGQQEQVGYIKHEKGKGYCVKSEKNPDWSGGCYPSHGKAEERLKQVEKFKHMKKGAVTPNDIAHDIRLVAARLANSTKPQLEVVLSDLQSIIAAMETTGQQEQQGQQQADWKMTLEDAEGDEPIPEVHLNEGEHQGQQQETAKSPPGWGGVVEKMVKDHGFSKERAEALSWNQYNEGHTPHVKE